jgi:hypothetical protein
MVLLIEQNLHGISGGRYPAFPVPDDIFGIDTGRFRPVENCLNGEFFRKTERQMVVDMDDFDRGNNAISIEIEIPDPVSFAQGSPPILEITRISPMPNDTERVGLFKSHGARRCGAKGRGGGFQNRKIRLPHLMELLS